jgi:hypothetical protein
MTNLNRISVDTALFGGPNSLPYDIDVGARALVLAHTEMDTILRSRGLSRVISHTYRHGRENGDERTVSQPMGGASSGCRRRRSSTPTIRCADRIMLIDIGVQ